jgi:hypothetical protein
MELGNTAVIQATAMNIGQKDESAVQFQLYIEDIMVASTLIANLSSTEEFTLEYNWTPEYAGDINITAYVFPVINETYWGNNQLVFISRIQDTQPPEWVVPPVNQILVPGQVLSYQLEATDLSGIASWDVSDRVFFVIDGNGCLTSAVALPPGIFLLAISLADPYNNTLVAVISVTRTLGLHEPFIAIVVTALIIASYCILVEEPRRTVRSSP